MLNDADIMIKLTTQEGEEVKVKKNVIVQSVLIRGILDEADNDEPVPLPCVTKPILEKVITFLKYINKKPMPPLTCPLVDADLKKSITDHWFVDYVDVEKKHLYDIHLPKHP